MPPKASPARNSYAETVADLSEQNAPSGPSETPSTSTPPQPSKGRKAARTILPIVLFAVIGVASALLATGVFVYQKATEPDRSTPVISTDAFLHAVFVEESDDRVGLYTCADWPAPTASKEMKAQIDPEAKVSWERLTVVGSVDERATIEVRMLFRYPEDVTPSGERYWTFDLVNVGGWRVCGAHPRT